MLKNTKIKRVMTPAVITVGPEAVFPKILNIFNENTFHHLPVVDANRKLIGIISKEDILKVAYEASTDTTGKTYTLKHYNHLVANDIMTASPISIDPEADLYLAADLFLSNLFHAIPVVEDEKLVGIITTHDILKYSLSQEA